MNEETRLTPLDTLVWFDGPVLFVATCRNGDRYVCYPITESEKMSEYLCIRVANIDLQGFLAGRVSLLNLIILNRNNLFLDVYTKEGNQPAPIPIPFELLDEDDLPDADFYYKNENIH